MTQPMQNPKDISDPTTTLDMALKLTSKNAVQNQGTQNVGNQNGLREDHYASNCIVKPRKQYAAYLHKQMQIAQKEEAGIQLTSEEFDFMAATGAYEETKKVTANCNLQNNLQLASSSGTQSDKAPVYDLDGSAEVHHSENCYNNDIFNMFTQEEQYTELLEPIPEPHQVQQNDSNVISVVSSVEQSGGTVEQHPANIEETRAYFESLYNNLATEVEKVNLVNRKMKETNAELTTELARNHYVVRQPNAFQSERPKRVPPKVVESNDLLNSITSNLVPITTKSNVMKNDKVIAPGMFRINPSKTSRVDNDMPNKHVKARVKSTAKTRRPQHRSITKNDRVPSASKSSCIKNKDVEVEEHHRNLLLSKNKKHVSSECNNVKLAIQNDKSKVVCAMFLRNCLLWNDHIVSILGYGDL
ncbi:hypothetical protein Tco_1288631 [Tanacetum coccineum]